MIVSWILVIAIFVLNLVVLPYFLFLLMTAVAAFFMGGRKLSIDTPRSRLLVVIPAHNEDSGIESTVHSCLDRHIIRPGSSTSGDRR